MVMYTIWKKSECCGEFTQTDTCSQCNQPLDVELH